MKNVVLILFCVGWLIFWPAAAWEATVTCSFSAVVPSLLTVTLGKGTNSAASDPNTVVFDKLDSQDVPTTGDPGFMYAPYRSLTGKNWHLAKIYANASGTVSLQVDATLTGIDKTTKLKVWFGGFFRSGESTALAGTTSTAWEPMGTTKTTPGPFIGECPLNYQLNISGVTAQTYTGTITITVIQ